MEREGKIFLGILFVAGAVGGAVALWKKYKGSGGGTAAQVANIADLGNGILKVTITWSGGAGVVEGDIAGGVQTDRNIIDGHFFTTEALVQQAAGLYNNNPEPCWQNPSQSGCQRAAQMVLTPQYRLATGNNQAELYCEKPGSGAVIEFWTKLGTDTSKLILNDPVGTNNANLTLTPSAWTTYKAM